MSVDHKQEEAMMQPSEVNNIPQELTNQINENEIEQFQPIEAINTSSQQTVSQSVMGIQVTEAKTSAVMPSDRLIVNPMMVNTNNQTTSSITPSECACGGNGTIQIVYAIGELGTDFGTEARRDSFTQANPSGMPLLEYLNDNPYEAQSLIWTLSLDATPIYAIAPTGPFASVTYDRLRAYLADENVERISVPGYIGSSVRLMSGQVVPVIIPEVRGMYSWSVAALVEAVAAEGAENQLRDYLNRIYYDYRNLGITSQERALNFSATNAFQVSEVITQAAGTERVLDSISVEKSPICRPDSDCYDVKLTFFDPENNQRCNRVFRFTVDVSDVIPVTIGQVRSWSQA